MITANMDAQGRRGQSISHQRQWLVEWSSDKPEVRIKRRNRTTGLFQPEDDWAVLHQPDYLRGVTRLLWLPPTHGIAFVVAAGAYVTVWQQSRVGESASEQKLGTECKSMNLGSEDVGFRIRCLIPRIRGRVADIALSPVDLDGNLQLAVCTFNDSIYIYDCLDQFDLKVWDLQEEIWCGGCRSVCWGPLISPRILIAGLSQSSSALIKCYEQTNKWTELDSSSWVDVYSSPRTGDVTAVSFANDSSGTGLLLALVQARSLHPELLSFTFNGNDTDTSMESSASKWEVHRLRILQEGASPEDIPMDEVPESRLEWDAAGATFSLVLSLDSFDLIRLYKREKPQTEDSWECVHARLLEVTRD